MLGGATQEIVSSTPTFSLPTPMQRTNYLIPITFSGQNRCLSFLLCFTTHTGIKSTKFVWMDWIQTKLHRWWQEARSPFGRAAIDKRQKMICCFYEWKRRKQEAPTGEISLSAEDDGVGWWIQAAVARIFPPKTNNQRNPTNMENY